MKYFITLLVLLLAAAGSPLAAVEIVLPPEDVRLAPSPLPGYPLAVAACATCHSADYILYQPNSSRAYWQGVTVKMQKTFGAPIPEPAIAPLVDYLVKTYGAERSKETPTPVSEPRAPARQTGGGKSGG